MMYERPRHIIALAAFWIALITLVSANILIGTVHFTVTTWLIVPGTFYMLALSSVWLYIMIRYFPKAIVRIETNGKAILSLLNGKKIVIHTIESLKHLGTGIRIEYPGGSKNIDIFFFKNNKQLIKDLESLSRKKE